MRATIYLFFLLPALLHACIGIDYKDDPVVGARIAIQTEQVEMIPGEMIMLTAIYYDEYGVEKEVSLMWTSSMTQIASVNSQGVVTAESKGQAIVMAAYQDVKSAPILVNVDVGTITITARKELMDIGEMFTFEAVVKDFNGEIVDTPVTWFSGTPSVVSIDAATGKATANDNGTAGIYAEADGIRSVTVNVTVGSVRMGTFVSAGGYATAGTATLSVVGGNVTLALGSDFTTSFALGTYCYLSNATGGTDVLSGGLEISQITKNGAHSFNVTAVKPGVKLSDYRYVIMLCKPAGITFGYADLNQ